MKLLVVSDSHGYRGRLEQALEAQPDAMTVMFLGDGLRDAEAAEQDYPMRRFLTVPGNCDPRADGFPAREESFGGVRILFTHGHLYGVKSGTDTLLQAAQSRGVSVALYGHTHRAEVSYRDGIWLMNPGSIGYDGCYGLLELGPAGILPQLMQL